MPCGCNKTGTRFIYTAPSGTKVEYRSEVEAKAAVIRGGGSYAPKA